MKKETRHLKIASVIQIILGIITIVLAQFLLEYGDVSTANLSGEKALSVLFLTYGGAVFQIFAGIIGLCLSHKKSIITVILGLLVFIPQLIVFLHTKDNYLTIALNCIMLVFPYYYLHSAYKIFKQDKKVEK